MKKKLYLINIFIYILLFSACINDSSFIKKMPSLPELPLYSNMGINIYVDASGDVYTWGYDQYNNFKKTKGYGNGNSLGQGSEVLYSNIPTLIYEDISYISYNRITTANGQMVEWGRRIEDTDCIPKIVRENQKDIYTYSSNAYLTKSGDLYAVFNQEDANQSIPYGTEDTLMLKNVVQFQGGYALKSDGTIWAFNIDADTKLLCNPYQILDGVSEIIGSFNGTGLFLESDKTLWTIGNNEYGMIGNGEFGDWDDKTPDYVDKPYMVMEKIEKAWVINERRFYALDTEGNLYGWGLNTYNILLDQNYVQTSYDSNSGLTERSIVAEPKFLMADVKEIYDYGNCAFAVKNDGTLWSWGAADRGELGNGKYAKDVSLNLIDMAHRMIGKDAIICGPEKIMDDVQRMLGTTQALKFALKEDGTIMYWGFDVIYVDAGSDWDTDLSQLFQTEAYSKSVIIPTPQVFDIKTFHSEYQ